MVQKIVRLSNEVINKIAAGEVVENPASIAKELIENSLDAGALHIDIAIEGGGVCLLKIEDDGCGMGYEDALLSLERYATSKIQTEQDLSSLTTMGFRGEALAAIAAVSRLEMRTSEGRVGTLIAAKGGKIETAEPCARNQGTTISVCDLFFNIPARKKFLKSPSANTATLIRIVETIALAHPAISFTVSSDGKRVFVVEPQEPRERIEDILDPMSHEIQASGIWGLTCSPEASKMHRREQYLFVNKRAIFSPLIAKAVKSGYGTMIAESAYPSFVLFLEVMPEMIDVNVHPQKREVRFAEEGKIFLLVEQAVSSSLLNLSHSFSRTLTFPNTASSFPLTEERLIPGHPPTETVQSSFNISLEMRPLAIIDGYFFLQTERLLLIDLRRAYARVLYESLKERKEASQNLLWPLEIQIEEERIVEELQTIGIECRLIGKKTIAIDALPPLLEPTDFPNFLSAWKEGKRLDATTHLYTKRAKRKFTLDEACILWKQLLKCRETFYDPAGRQIWEQIDAEKLKKILV